MNRRWNYRTLEQAVRAVITSTGQVQRKEMVTIDCATGRVLAETIRAITDVPPWNRSTVDGYAVRSVDAEDETEKVLRIVGDVKAGSFFKGRVRHGECVRIATGAPMPEGTDASVMFEKTVEQGGNVKFSSAVSKWEEVSLKGVDIRKGAVVARKGSFLRTGVIGALASQGFRKVPVLQRPVVAIVPGGDEIAPVGTRTRRGQIYDVNSHTIASIIRKAGGEEVIMPTAVDDRGTVRRALLSALRYDACVFASGSSMGQRDFVAGVIEKEGKLLFHGVRIRPGRPTMFGMVKGKPVFGLAGHPVSSFLGAHYLLAPSVRKMAGNRDERGPTTVSASYSGEKRPGGRMAHLVPVRLEGDKCIPVFKESGAITSISLADGIVMQQAGQAVAEGDTVDVELLD